MPNPAPSNFSSYSLLTPYGYQSGSCGYCKDPKTSQRTPESRGSFYASSKRMTVDHYQYMVERAWRRSGETLYKPDQLRSCCPHYTIRLPAAQLKPSRDQRQALNRWNRYVLGDKYIEEAARRYPISRAEKRIRNHRFDLVSTVHESEYANVKTPPEPEHRFEVTLESTEFTDEKYTLFEQYQRLVHKEPPSAISKAGFKRFLCDTPLVSTTREVNGKEQALGSRHQCYRLGGKLIALGVVDLLPHTVSAVYFIYDQAYERWSFGKLSALREAALAIEGGYEFYNMGFYIHSCPKMRYKCDYKPQHVLDPDTYRWDVLDDEVKARLEAQRFVSLSRERDGASPIVPEKYTQPVEAADSEESLFAFGMPGLQSAEAVEEEMSAHTPRVLINIEKRPRVILASGWEEGSITEYGTLKCVVGELLGCVGPEIVREIIVNFG